MSTRQGEVSLRVGYTFFVNETTRMLVDIPGTLSHVSETMRSFFEGGVRKRVLTLKGPL